MNLLNETTNSLSNSVKKKLSEDFPVSGVEIFLEAPIRGSLERNYITRIYFDVVSPESEGVPGILSGVWGLWKPLRNELELELER